jgi:hypothetical protein
MKLVALKDFANVKRLGLDAKEAGLTHELHVHKGLRFAIGKTEVFKELSEEQKGVVTELLTSGSAVVDNKDNADIIARIDTEVKVAADAAEKAEKNAARGGRGGKGEKGDDGDKGDKGDRGRQGSAG